LRKPTAVLGVPSRLTLQAALKITLKNIQARNLSLAPSAQNLFSKKAN
jgi:hypothetical protein